MTNRWTGARSHHRWSTVVEHPRVDDPAVDVLRPWERPALDEARSTARPCELERGDRARGAGAPTTTVEVGHGPTSPAVARARARWRRVGDDGEVGHRHHRARGIGVDRDDPPGRAEPRGVLHSPRDPERDVERRVDGDAGRPDLALVADDAAVRDRPGRAERRGERRRGHAASTSNASRPPSPSPPPRSGPPRRGRPHGVDGVDAHELGVDSAVRAPARPRSDPSRSCRPAGRRPRRARASRRRARATGRTTEAAPSCRVVTSSVVGDGGAPCDGARPSAGRGGQGGRARPGSPAARRGARRRAARRAPAPAGPARRHPPPIASPRRPRPGPVRRRRGALADEQGPAGACPDRGVLPCREVPVAHGDRPRSQRAPHAVAVEDGGVRTSRRPRVADDVHLEAAVADVGRERVVRQGRQGEDDACRRRGGRRRQ